MIGRGRVGGRGRDGDRERDRGSDSGRGRNTGTKSYDTPTAFNLRATSTAAKRRAIRVERRESSE